ncbi:hypothetical protein DQ04_00751070 [Trypanosoma grayi]|uniref:hypothetical protein n=1 Tax=Trypanosoma grayi TaxID=71804 RepID=UPI0004F42862|nr:hypothetical protein DQ04_00751070 [Trypanosoma grayi]KEG13847.1 hypothetical protein DQ04_00751070 [Trypanosoma grayi]
MAVRALLHIAHKTLVCSVCYDLFHNPVAFPCGHVFCRACAERCVAGRPHCPLCNHGVASRRASAPLPTVTALTALVRDIAESLRQLQQGVLPPLQLLEGEPAPTVVVAASAVGSCTTPTRPSMASDGAAKARSTSVVGRDTSVPHTQLLRTPLLPRAVETYDVAWDDTETQRVQPVSPTPRRAPQFVALRHTSSDPAEGANAHSGCCKLCGLDIRNRAIMRRYLRKLLDTDPLCDKSRVRQLNEATLFECLGPMWQIRLDTECVAGTSGGGQRKRGRSETTTSPDMSPQPSPLLLLVHQACLESCLLQERVAGATTVAVHVSDMQFQKLCSAGGVTACASCGRSAGRCLLLCRCCQQKAYHYPCAMLTGARVCGVSGALLCAECAGAETAEAAV